MRKWYAFWAILETDIVAYKGADAIKMNFLGFIGWAYSLKDILTCNFSVGVMPKE